jgi:hypothetical protein
MPPKIAREEKEGNKQRIRETSSKSEEISRFLGR